MEEREICPYCNDAEGGCSACEDYEPVYPLTELDMDDCYWEDANE